MSLLVMLAARLARHCSPGDRHLLLAQGGATGLCARLKIVAELNLLTTWSDC